MKLTIIQFMENYIKIFLVISDFFILLQSQNLMRDDKENIPALKQKEKKQTWFP